MRRARCGHVLSSFSTFCPKAIAGIGKLPDTVEDGVFRFA